MGGGGGANGTFLFCCCYPQTQLSVSNWIVFLIVYYRCYLHESDWNKIAWTEIGWTETELNESDLDLNWGYGWKNKFSTANFSELAKRDSTPALHADVLRDISQFPPDKPLPANPPPEDSHRTISTNPQNSTSYNCHLTIPSTIAWKSKKGNK